MAGLFESGISIEVLSSGIPDYSLGNDRRHIEMVKPGVLDVCAIGWEKAPMHIHIEKLIPGGAGMGTHEGRRVFVPFAAPGDELEVEVVADHGSWMEARIVDITQPSPDRVEPICPVFGKCGGCQWQHLSYDSQLRAKREILRESLMRIGKIADPEVLETLPSPQQWHYRNRIQLHVNAAGEVGFYRAKSKEVVAFASCPIADEHINAELAHRREEIAKRDRGIALRVEGDESFSQVNTAQNEQLKKVLIDWMRELPHEHVAELHAGSGNFTFAMAAIASEIFASEIDGRAVAAAQKRIEREGITNVAFVRAPAHKAFAHHVGACDALLIDPPRKGCPEAIESIVRLGPQSILAISCDPATLARDLRALCDQGYRFVRTLPIDMFPQTFHVESLTLLQRVSGRL